MIDADRPTFRGALHCHSDRSDGIAPPLEVLEAYRGAGFDFVALTDHYESMFGWRVTEPPANAPILAIRALELSTGQWDDPRTVWVNAVGVPDGFGGPTDPLEACEALAAAGAYLTVVHPGLNHQAHTDLPVLDLIDAVEVHTQSVAGMWPDQADGTYYADALLGAGRRVLLNAADDAHFFHPRDRFGGYVEVQADELSVEAVLAALNAGRYYSSTGPRIRSVEVREGRVTIATDPCYAIACTSHGARWTAAQRVIAAPGAVTEVRLPDGPVTLSAEPDHRDEEQVVASFDLEPYLGSHCRLTVIDDEGRRAWTNPIWPTQ